MSETTSARISSILARVASGELQQQHALAQIDQLVMAERIDAANQGHVLTRKLFHLPVAA